MSHGAPNLHGHGIVSDVSCYRIISFQVMLILIVSSDLAPGILNCVG